MVVSAEVHMTETTNSSNTQDEYYFNPNVTPKKTLQELKSQNEGVTVQSPKVDSLLNSQIEKDLEDHINEVSIPEPQQYVQVTDDTNVAGNVIIPNTCDNSISQVFEHQDECPIAITSSTPMKCQNVTSSPFSEVNQENYEMEKHLAKPITEEIIQKLNSLDQTSLVQIQDWIDKRTTFQSYSNELVGEPNVDGNINKLLLNRMSGFVPIGTITEFPSQSQSSIPSETEDKNEVKKCSNAEQVFNIPESMYAYIYNKESDDVILVKLVPEDEDLSTYTPVEKSQKDFGMMNDKKSSIGGISNKEKQLKSKVSKISTGDKPTTIPKVQKNRRVMHRATANWVKVCNRYVHSKFVKEELCHLRKKWKKSDTNVEKLQERNPHNTSRQMLRKNIKRKENYKDEDPDYKPTKCIEQLTGTFFYF